MCCDALLGNVRRRRNLEMPRGQMAEWVEFDVQLTSSVHFVEGSEILHQQNIR